MITFESSGSFVNVDRFLERMAKEEILSALNQYAELGVLALASATPSKSGATANAWSCEVTSKRNNYTITWSNSNMNDGVNVAVILQYGHGTGTGGYVQGRDYINPAIQPIFDKIADEVWKVVTSA